MKNILLVIGFLFGFSVVAEEVVLECEATEGAALVCEEVETEVAPAVVEDAVECVPTEEVPCEEEL